MLDVDFYRTYAQAKVLEEAFSASGIPYQVLELRNERKIGEIEETIAYLQPLVHAKEAGGPPEVPRREAKLLNTEDFFDSRVGMVALMTMRMVKGPELPAEFLTGFDGGLLPCTITKEGMDEEERRFFYSGMTRAKKRALSYPCKVPILYGRRLTMMPSPYLGAIPESLVDKTFFPSRARKQ